jgi:ABC-type antimicrobial peptide transport system permease subunit
MSELVSDFLAPYNVLLAIMSGFAVIALFIAAIGIYGLIAFLTAVRVKEFGVRLALGAQPREIAGAVVSQSLKLVALSAVIGLFGAVASARLVRSLLYGVGIVDPVTISLIALSLGLIALVAAALPAFRATRIDPVRCLRAE